jgi:hypothetical protein
LGIFFSAKKPLLCISKKMKHFFIIVLVLVFANASFAQHDSIKRKKSIAEFALKNYKGDPKDRLIFEAIYTSWLGIPKNITPDWKCIGFNFAMMFDKPIKNSNFSFGYGAGLYCHNFSSNANYLYKTDSITNIISTVMEPKMGTYSSNKYSERSVEIPLELRFRTKTNSNFKIMLGVKIGYVFNDYKKTDDVNGKIRLYDLKNINRFRYGVNFRIGVEKFCLSASYYLSEAFNSHGPQGIHPFSIGLAIIPY